MKYDVGGWDNTGDLVGQDIEGLDVAVYRDNKVIALFSNYKDAEALLERLEAEEQAKESAKFPDQRTP
jgi:hypothetical protein